MADWRAFLYWAFALFLLMEALLVLILCINM